jgi:uncharacterized HAD superfamily protein
MKMGVDFDGTVTIQIGFLRDRLNLPLWIYFVIFSVMDRITKPNKKIINAMNRYSGNGNKVIVVSSRPKELKGFIEKWLNRNKIVVDEIFTIGPGKNLEKRKFDVLVGEKVDIYVDDDPKTINFLNRMGINTILTERFIV